MAGDKAATRDALIDGARDIASIIAHKGSLAHEHVVQDVQRQIKGLASRTGQMFATASDEVYEALGKVDGIDTTELRGQYAQRFPIPSAGK